MASTFADMETKVVISTSIYTSYRGKSISVV